MMRHLASIGTGGWVVALLSVARTAALAVTLAAPSMTALPGNQVTVPITLDNDTPIRAVQFTLTDTPDRLRFVGFHATPRSFALTVDAFGKADGSVNVVLLSLAAPTIAAGSGAIIELDMSLGTDATPGEIVALTFADVHVADAAGTPVATTVTDGSFGVSGPSTATPTETATATIAPTEGPTLTATVSSSATPTDTPTEAATPTATASATATRTPTETLTPSATFTATASATSSATATPTSTPSETPTSVPTATPSDTHTAMLTPVPTDTPPPTSTATTVPRCAGDCDGDGQVTVDELLILVNIGLEVTPTSTCPSADLNQDGSITVEEILNAVGHALAEC